MSLNNYSKYLAYVYNYLDYKGIKQNKEINKIIDECTKEIIEINSFTYKYQEFDYIIEVLNKEPYIEFLSGCKGYYISAMTLGPIIDQRIRFYSKIDLNKMFIFDACSSGYLEYMADEYELSLGKNLTYRFCPGYGGSDISDIIALGNLLNISKMGIEILDSGLMVPQKTMVGIIGIDKKTEKNCNNCFNKKSCNYKKEGRVCYN